MNLAWLVAIYSPHEIAAHPNFNTEIVRAEAELAAILLDRTPPSKAFKFPGIKQSAGVNDPAVDLIYGLITSQSGENGLEELGGAITATDPNADLARITALATVFSTLGGDSERYDLIDRVLTVTLARFNGRHSSPSKLCQAVLYQQRALRKRDFGFKFSDDVISAARALSEVEIDSCLNFELNDVTAYTPELIVTNIIEGLKRAIWSVYPERNIKSSGLTSLIPPLMSQIVQVRAESLYVIHQGESHQLGRLLEEKYKEQLTRNSSQTFGKSAPDIYFQTLAYGLLGHAAVYASRKELAIMRIVRHLPDLSGVNVSHCLRLLRLACANSELTLLVDRLIYDGPLDALIQDASNILNFRTHIDSIRAGELQVLSAAAELLSSTDADRALHIALSVLDKGGPTLPPGNWQTASTLNEPAWLAAADLASRIGEDSALAERLLRAMSSPDSQDELWDRVFSKVIRRIRWELVDLRLQNECKLIFEGLPGEVFESSRNQLIRAKVLDDRPPTISNTGDTYTDLSDALSHYLRTESAPPQELVDKIVQTSVRGMRTVREEARSGQHSGMAVDPSTLAAFVVEFDKTSELTSELLAFVTDQNVFQSVRRHALKILSESNVSIPQSIIERHRDRILLEISAPDTSSISWFEEATRGIPNIAALRFVAAHDILPTPVVIRTIFPWVTSTDRRLRKDTAEAIAQFISSQPSVPLQGMAIQMSYDQDAEVRAAIVPGLVASSQAALLFSDESKARLIEMLDDDGILVPLVVLRRICNLLDSTWPKREKITEIRSNHPSRRIRDAAAKISLPQG
ncbi:hypothetical protein [Nocardia sp. NPDC058633]|uniref:hypothetical protein n=1 Tax=Nocardia sp. NPDC058633 TaxID=3346568 RepID=UPI0036606E3C